MYCMLEKSVAKKGRMLIEKLHICMKTYVSMCKLSEHLQEMSMISTSVLLIDLELLKIELQLCHTLHSSFSAMFHRAEITVI